MTLSDYRKCVDDVTTKYNVVYFSQVASASEYYPFGQLLTDGNYSSGSYRYGFNGMEKDDEVKGTGNSYTTLFRQYDPRLGRWMSLDPAMAKYPGQSPYVAFNNNPIYFTDPSGDDPPEDDTHTVKSGESVWAIAKGRLGNDATNAEIAELTNNIIKWNGLNEDGDISPGQELTVVNPDNQNYVGNTNNNSEPTIKPANSIQITPEFDDFSENSSEDSPSFDPVGNTLTFAGTTFNITTETLIDPATYTDVNGKTRSVYKLNKSGNPVVNQNTGKLRVNSANAASKIKLYTAVDNFGKVLTVMAVGHTIYRIYEGDYSNTATGWIEGSLDLGLGALPLFVSGPWGWIPGAVWFGGKSQIEINRYQIENGINPGRHLCFIGGTKILMADSSSQNIEDIIAGDRILSYNTFTRQIEIDTVLKTTISFSKDLYRLEFSNGTENTNTGDHPYYVIHKGWCVVDVNSYKDFSCLNVQELSVGDSVIIFNDNKLQVVILNKVSKSLHAKTYNLSRVKRNNNFFVNGILVHNKPQQ